MSNISDRYTGAKIILTDIDRDIEVKVANNAKTLEWYEEDFRTGHPRLDNIMEIIFIQEGCSLLVDYPCDVFSTILLHLKRDEEWIERKRKELKEIVEEEYKNSELADIRF